jgi:hypothetical protein
MKRHSVKYCYSIMDASAWSCREDQNWLQLYQRRLYRSLGRHDGGYFAKEGFEDQNMVGMQNALEDLAKTVPAAKNAKPEQFIDHRFLDNLEKSGLLKELYP